MAKKITLTKQELDSIKEFRKRGGQVVPFNLDKITQAVLKAMNVTGEGEADDALFIAKKVYKDLLKLKKIADSKDFIPAQEMVQDLVEEELAIEGFLKTAKAYILYREKRAELRREVGPVPDHIRRLSKESKKYFKNPLGEFVYYRTYSRWIPEEQRRETWVETVKRFMDFMKENLGKKLDDREYEQVYKAILSHKAMPSMRLLQFAGKAARATNVCAYNCSYIAPQSFQDFAEVMYVSMCGTGVGWEVSSRNIQALPQIKAQTGKKLSTFVVPDSKEGWAEALVLGMETWANGMDVDFDFSKLRPAGARLMTMGGKSSGPEPLRQLLRFTRERMLKRQGKRLKNIDAHDILCKIGECVVVGGVRRSAMISLSDLDDEEIRDAKKGQFWNTEPQRSLANNSAIYESKPSAAEFLDEWLALMKSGCGERGFFNRGSLPKMLPKRRVEYLKKKGVIDPENGRVVGFLGTNPCGEIILQSKQFCNLSEVVARADDTEETLAKKIRIAAILGTYQASLTDFKYLSPEWKKNCEEERLLGVSITGQWDCPTVRQPEVLKKLKKIALETNRKYAKRFGINPSTCVTCVKPSGTLSQMVDSSSGMHPRYAPYYIRRIRIASTDSLFKMLRDQGIPYHPEVGQSSEDANTFVLDFPVKAPEGAVFKNDLSAIDQLEHWKMVKTNYTEHNPSVTISVGEDEWIPVAEWLYKNWDIVGGLSFLPRSDYVYRLAPYEKIEKEDYEKLISKFKYFDFAKIVSYERQDETEQKRELACVGGVCDVDDVQPVEASKTAEETFSS